jgi:hypothetical protein
VTDKELKYHVVEISQGILAQEDMDHMDTLSRTRKPNNKSTAIMTSIWGPPLSLRVDGVQFCIYMTRTSMFLQVLLPEKRMLFQPNLAKAVGSDYVARRIEELKPLAHVYGHTHFAWDTTIKGVRYLQWPLAYPRERKYVTSINLFRGTEFMCWIGTHVVCGVLC